MRYITLNEVEKTSLEKDIKSSSNYFFIQRATCILLSNSKIQIKKLSEHFNMTKKTIYQWFDLWEKGGLQGLKHKGGTGAKLKLSDVPKDYISMLVVWNARNLKVVLEAISRDYGIIISKDTLKRYLKKS